MDYLEARELLQQRDRASAVRRLEQALGSHPGNPVVARELEHLLDYHTSAGEIALALVRAELRKLRGAAG